jgi:predicted TIM-barrel fold metal-dependent hydrolase
MADWPIIDAYAHVGLPRFQSVEDYEAVMARSGVGQAVLCSFDSSPDLAPIHAAFSASPERFRGLGVPLGNDRGEIEAAARSQLDSGFSGLRLADADVLDRPWLLDLLADYGRIAVVCGAVSSDTCARTLLANLERHSEAVVIGGHFAGVDMPSKLKAGPAAELFSHPRFNVVFSRQGGFAADTVKAWSQAVITKTGWSRVMWGSEAPVMFWRNETMETALGWINHLEPTDEELRQFLGGNTQRLYFGQQLDATPLRMPFDPWDRARDFPATLWANGLPMEQSIAGRLVHDWQSSGGKGRLGDHLKALLERTLPPLPGKEP